MQIRINITEDMNHSIIQISFLMTSFFILTFTIASSEKSPLNNNHQFSSSASHSGSRLLEILSLSCNVVGCKNCIRTDFCEECYDSENTFISEGKCICNRLLKEKPDSTNICSACIVPGCASCISGSSSVCSTCIDPKAILRNGTCNCDKEMMMFNRAGFCHACNVAGCERCSKGSGEFCEICIDSVNTQIINRKCVCKNDIEKPDFLGYCAICLVPGCASCVSGN